MVFLVGGANSAAGYDIDNSLRFNDDAELAFTPGSEGNRRTFTISVWVKRGGLGTDFICSSGTGSGAKFELSFTSTDQLWAEDKSGVTLQTTAKYRDSSAWMHIVYKHDSTPSTPGSSNIALYVNGSQITSFDTYETYPSQNAQGYWMDDEEHNIGKRTYADVFFDGYMAEFVAIDGLALSPSSFGETDEDSGIWKPKDVSGLTFGTNGFYMEFKGTGTDQDASGIGADTSGEDNHFAVTSLAATDQTTDTPTNNFCTLNPLDNYLQAATFAEGNCKLTTNASNYSTTSSTMGVANGKWYFEGKCTTVNDSLIGISAQTETSASNGLGQNANQHGYLSSGNARTNGSDTSSGYDSYTTNDIISVAFDCDNNKVYFGKNGTWQNSADPAAGSNGISITAAGSTSTGFYTPGWGDNGSSAAVWEANFGNPSFSISSGNADDAGYGNFEYDVPAGFYALCTKNLAEYG